VSDVKFISSSDKCLLVQYLDVKGFIEIPASKMLSMLHQEELFRWIDLQLSSWAARLRDAKATTTEHGWLERVRKSQREPEVILST